MAFEILKASDDAVLSLRATDCLAKEDIDRFFQVAEEKIRKYGKARTPATAGFSRLGAGGIRQHSGISSSPAR